MKDSRIAVWTPATALTTGSTTNAGLTIDLFASGAMQGGTSDGTGLFGISVEILQTFVSGTQTTVWTWEISPDNFTTTYAGGYIGTVALTAAGTGRLKGNLETRMRYARIRATNTGVGASTANAAADDWGGVTGTVALSNG